MQLNKVTVFGATGAQSSPVVRQLLEAGVGVKAVGRDADKIAQMFGERAEAVNADLNDAISLRNAFEGADAAWLQLSFKSDWPTFFRQLSNALEAAKAANLPRLVYTTGGTTTDNLPPIRFVENNRAAAQQVLESGIAATVLRPTIYLQNLFAYAKRDFPQGILSYPPLDASRKMSWTAHEDQAAFAVAALTSDAAIGKSFDIASPQAVSGDELAGILSAKIGREISYQPTTTEQFRQNFARFAGEDLASDLAQLYAELDKLPAEGAVVDLKPVTAILPVELTPVAQWVEAQNWG